MQPTTIVPDVDGLQEEKETWPAIQKLLSLGQESSDFLSLSLSKNAGNKICSFCS